MINLVFNARVEAMRLARNQVRQDLKAQGVKLSYLKASELTELAKVWFEDHHDELIDVALHKVLAAVQRTKAHAKPVSAVQISGAK